jgi:uncharacterized protein (DUF1015 family)
MPLIRPFSGLRPAPQFAAEVAAPPYDVLTTEEARARAAGRPNSFLHISKPEIDLPAGTDPHDDTVYARGRENFARMIAEGVLARDPAPCFYLYRLEMGGHAQTGLVAAASVQAYEDGRIRRHEFTRPDKEDDRTRQIDALNAQTGPVFLTYRHRGGIDRLASSLVDRDPDVDLRAGDGVRHTLWVVSDPADCAAITAAFDGVERLYVADGHHRSAAAARVAAARRRANPAHTGKESYNFFLAVVFPDDQVQILDYNRVVRDLNGLSRTDFLRRVGEAFDAVESQRPCRPTRHAEFGMYLKGQWYRLRRRPERTLSQDPVARLDVSILADEIIGPVLGVVDPRRDRRIDFVGGIRGLEELQRRVDSGEMAVAFALYPTGLEELMDVADADGIMPPKSTWFEPKLADGLVSHVLDG